MKKTIIILLALACLMLVGCSNKPEEDQQPQQKEVTIRVIAYGDDGFIISNDVKTFNEGAEFDLTDLVPEKIRDSSVKYNRAADEKTMSQLQGVAQEDKTILVSYTHVLYDDDCHFIGTWKAENDNGSITQFTFYNNGKGGMGAYGGTIDEIDYRINFETKKIYIGKFSDLLDEEKYTVYTYSFTIDNDGTITLVNVEDNSKQILKKDTSSGSMYK